ncbi:MAG: UDP-glucose/GDP-mannose dehydrogenase family protein, partial [Nitrospina sp.]|nr:UDP-glucose/GDP-mannose dehydrogenase family protein [Nitrospina sp.]
PGCGFGGYCLPKDTQALYNTAREHQYRSKLLESVLEINNYIGKFLTDQFKPSVSIDSNISLLGLSFKANSDDVRQSPSATIIDLLLNAGYKNLMAYDPMATNNFKKEYSYDIDYSSSLEEAVKYADAIILLTTWEEFLEKKDLLSEKLVFDFRYYLEK